MKLALGRATPQEDEAPACGSFRHGLHRLKEISKRLFQRRSMDRPDEALAPACSGCALPLHDQC